VTFNKSLFMSMWARLSRFLEIYGPKFWDFQWKSDFGWKSSYYETQLRTKNRGDWWKRAEKTRNRKNDKIKSRRLAKSNILEIYSRKKWINKIAATEKICT
jgi:hypothetical protein